MVSMKAQVVLSPLHHHGFHVFSKGRPRRGMSLKMICSWRFFVPVDKTVFFPERPGDEVSKSLARPCSRFDDDLALFPEGHAG
jgi:hypothetical protein